MAQNTSLPTPVNPGPFGHKQRTNFFFKDGFTQFNHGSYGSHPRTVEENFLKWHNHAEQNPDYWVRRELKPALTRVRSILANVLHCDKDELAMVNNTTIGINSILRSIDWQPGDRIIKFSTTYDAVSKAIRFICDRHKDVGFMDVSLTFPMSDHDFIHTVETLIQDHAAKKDGTRIRLAVVDYISSVPAIVHPIKAVTDLLQSYGILVFVDGAHAIGQVPVDLDFLKPDFFITNCHKWLYSVRGSAALYVAKHHQATIHPAAIQGDYKNGFENEFSWSGTLDYSSILSIEGAVEFRKQYGEEAIMNYMHLLAVEGGKKMAEILGTDVMTEGQDQQVGSMVNVRLPIKDIDHPKIETPDYLIEHLMDKHGLFAPSYKHGGYFWTRVSAQIYLELEDFERLGHVWKEVIDELNAETDGH